MVPVRGRKTSPSYLNMVCTRRFRLAPGGEIARHLHREIEVVERDLFDVHTERNRRSRLKGRGREVGPERPSEFERGSSVRLFVRGRQLFLRPRRHGRTEPREELKVLTIGHGSETQEDRRGLQSLRRTPLAISPQDRGHRLGGEEHPGREKIATRPPLFHKPNG